MKKRISFMVGAAVIVLLLLSGCSTTPVALAPVGPNPTYFQTTMTTGQLEVFSALTARSEGNNPTWRQHSDYDIYSEQGQHLMRVDNTIGYYNRTPRVVDLPPGRYIVKARAKGALITAVPVAIEPGEVTEVHLDGNWDLSSANSGNLVYSPAGYPVGWRADITRSGGAR